MELKPYCCTNLIARDTLLIVPYGIETEQLRSYAGGTSSLLIVPYGIETQLQKL